MSRRRPHPWIAAKARQHEAFDVKVIDVRGMGSPDFAETFGTVGNPADPTFSAPIVKRWNENVRDGDAYLFITPEYNHRVPAALKNAIDSVFATFGFCNKPMACVAYSGVLPAAFAPSSIWPAWASSSSYASAHTRMSP